MKFISLVLVILTSITEIQCSGKGEVQFLVYEDTSGCGEGGCDFYFKNVVIEDEDGNELHRVEKTEHIKGDDNHGNKNTIYFSTVPELDKTFEVQIPTGKSIMISFEAWDEDFRGDQLQEDLESTWTDLIVLFSQKAVSSEWDSKLYTRTKGTDGEVGFTIQYRLISCDTYFTGLGCNSCVTDRFGADCTTYCEPSQGFYTCSSNGEKICEERRIGEDCTVCKEQFKGNNCEKCAETYYPEETCKVYCPPAPNRYTCTDQGQKQCLQNRTGSHCEECISNHYGDDCSKFCQETDNYTCDEYGGKLCKQHFYPAEKCDINCEPVPGNFTCNQTTGKKICSSGKAGSDCDRCENSNKEGQNCDECKQFFYGPECTIYCKPEDVYYNCSENGTRVCHDNTTTEEENCRKKNLNIPVIVGGVGGGLLFILVLTAVFIKVRRDMGEDKEETRKRTDSNVQTRDVRASERVVEHPTTTVVGRTEDFGTYVNIKRTNREDEYVKASAVGKTEDFGTYMYINRAKKEDEYVEASAVGRNKDVGTYVNTDRAINRPKKKNELVESYSVERKEDFGTYVNMRRDDINAEADSKKEKIVTYVNHECKRR